MPKKPLAIDAYCGLGGWAEGFLAEDYDVVGFDIERRPYPGDLVLQDVTTLDGAQFKDAACIVASPPCQAYSYMAMPWTRAKRMAEEIRAGGHYHLMRLNLLFDACFRIQREASEAAGRHIPMVVENVKGAQPWVGKARAHYGSYYLWGDVDSLGGKIVVGGLRAENVLAVLRTVKGQAPQGAWTPELGGSTSWFGTARADPTAIRKVQHQREHNSPPGVGQTPLFHGNTKHEERAVKGEGGSWFGRDENGRQTNPMRDGRYDGTKHEERAGAYDGVGGRKRPGLSLEKDGMNNYPKEADGLRTTPDGVRFSSRSEARKHASAVIAKIPFPLAQHVARCFKNA